MSILTYNLEVSYNLTKSDIKRLDKVDLILLKNALMTSSKVSRSLVPLDLGLVSVEFILKQKRVGYLHHLLNSDDNSIVKKVFLEQHKSTITGDWTNDLKKDLKDLEIDMNFEEIQSLSKAKWKELVRKRTKSACFESLVKEKQKLSKGKEIMYSKFEMQSYLRSGNPLLTDTKRKIFKLRCCDLLLECNFPTAFSDIKCVTGCDANYDQLH